ncbi:MAG: response regulator [bacterium]|nr:response regulator [Gammaproteobacteria bacterium]HIL97931.1 response regulator [Pseudomonadales bacterium]
MSNVLLVEDDRFLIDDLKTFIEYEGHTCVVYTGPDDVIENLDSMNRFDAIILDIMMARGSYLQEEDVHFETGELLYLKIRKKYPDLPVIIISAKNFHDMQIDFATENNVEMVSKPFDSTASELIKRIP